MNALEVAKRITTDCANNTDNLPFYCFVNQEELSVFCAAIIEAHNAMATLALNECEDCDHLGKEWIKKYTESEV
jgi:hypothetical protein